MAAWHIVSPSNNQRLTLVERDPDLLGIIPCSHHRKGFVLCVYSSSGLVCQADDASFEIESSVINSI